jgi:ubiquinone/menaquinone biosynthesis C-methylase UbiE
MSGRDQPRADSDGHETDDWHRNYGGAEAVARRRAAVAGKLRLLGFPAGEPVSVLDVCCGHGETLDCLHTLGARDLHGVDLTVPEALMQDSRFTVRRAGASALPFPEARFDWVLCIHSLHHLASAEEVGRFLREAERVLKPGGRLGIVDFPASPQIRLAFWMFRHGWLRFTPYLRWFTTVIREEWWFLRDYLPQWPAVHQLLHGGPLKVESRRRGVFYFHLTLRKAEAVV